MLDAIRTLVLAAVLAPPGTEAPPTAPATDAKPEGPATTLALPGQEPSRPFVPLNPRTAEEQARLDALREYVSARALEQQRRLTEAVRVLEKALEKDPESVAILRRLARLCFAQGRLKPAIDYSKRVVEIDPNDAATLQLLSDHYQRRDDLAAAEAILNGVLNNPKLEKTSPAFLLAHSDLGDLYTGRPGHAVKAADAYAKVFEGLDTKAASRLSVADQRRILSEDEAKTYQKFGDAFARAKRFELAIKAYRRGLVYEPEHPGLPRKIALALLKSGKAPEALAVLEPLLKAPKAAPVAEKVEPGDEAADDADDRPPADTDLFDLLEQVLKAMDRGAEIIPRLEKAAKVEPNNVPLQYALAQRLRDAGEAARADTVYKALLARQPDPQGFAARGESLRKQGKNEELLKLFEEALAPEKQPAGLESVKPQIESIVNDPAYADALLADGIKLLEADPPGLGRGGRIALAFIAGKLKKPDAVLALARLAVKNEPSAQTYLELVQAQARAGKFEEAAATLETMLEKFPEQKDAAKVVYLGRLHLQGGDLEAALKAARDALVLEPEEFDAQNLVGITLGRLNKFDEAIAHYKGLMERYPNNDAVTHLARSGLSNIYVSMDEFDKSEAELEALLVKEPDDPGINNDLGYLYADRGKDLEKAEGMIRKAVEEDPENAAYLDSLGWVLFKRGKLKEAIEPLEKAAKGNLGDATIHDHLGDVYFRLQEFARARASWEKAETLARKPTPPDRRLPEIRKKLQSVEKVSQTPKAATGANP